MQYPYTLVRSGRKTLALQVGKDLRVVVRAPRRTPVPQIEAFVRQHEGWIQKSLARMRDRADRWPEPDEAELKALKAAAQRHIPGRVEHYSRIMGLKPAGVRITSARTRHGSCSAKNRLCFSCLLMRHPEAAIDYVVVHELAHIVHKNHGAEFYRLIAGVLPDYQARRALLRE